MLVCGECGGAQWCNERCKRADTGHAGNECRVFATAEREYNRLRDLCEEAEEEGKVGAYASARRAVVVYLTMFTSTPCHTHTCSASCASATCVADK